jgi:hypothetical protein
MKTILLVFALALPLAAQVVSPATGKKFETRTINGSGGNTGVSINNVPQPPATTKARLTSYFILGEARQWKNKDGRSVVGAIITFEDAVVEIDAANPAAAREAVGKAPPAKLPAKPTLIRDGKLRLLVNQKPFEVPLDQLSEEDRKYVDDLNARLPK